LQVSRKSIRGACATPTVLDEIMFPRVPWNHIFSWK